LSWHSVELCSIVWQYEGRECAAVKEESGIALEGLVLDNASSSNDPPPP
jgi:hypothetical protein